MLSAFPQLFDYSMFAVAGLRLVFGFWFLSYGYTTLFRKAKQESVNADTFNVIISTLTLLVGLFSFIGLFTQIAILVGLFVLLLRWYLDIKTSKVAKNIFSFGFYIAIIGLALLFLGPGVFAIDLPL